MKKNSFKENLIEIHKIASIMPKTLNEAIHFEGNDLGNDEEIGPEIEDPTDEPIIHDQEPIENDTELNSDELQQEPSSEDDPLIDLDKGPGRELVDKIRKISLNGLAKMAETPELPEYDVLKKIWQLCDKSLAERKEKEGEEK